MKALADHGARMNAPSSYAELLAKLHAVEGAARERTDHARLQRINNVVEAAIAKAESELDVEQPE